MHFCEDKEVHNFTVKNLNVILDDPALAGRLRDKFGFAYKSIVTRG